MAGPDGAGLHLGYGTTGAGEVFTTAGAGVDITVAGEAITIRGDTVTALGAGIGDGAAMPTAHMDIGVSIHGALHLVTTMDITTIIMEEAMPAILPEEVIAPTV